MRTVQVPLLEYRKGFAVSIGFVGMLITFASVWAVWQGLPHDADLAHLGLVLLMIGSAGGWIGVLNLLLPIVLVKFWPRLDG